MKIKICPNCKTENRKEANFCKECRLDLTSVIVKTVKKPEEAKLLKISLSKIFSGVMFAAVIVFAVWYLWGKFAEDKTKKTVSGMVEIENGLNSLNNELAKKYSAVEIEQAVKYLNESKKSQERKDYAGSIEWLNQSREMVKLAKEKYESGKKRDYDNCMSAGKSNAEKGQLEEAKKCYQEALNYIPDDKTAKNEIEFVEKKQEAAMKQAEAMRQAEEQKKRQEQIASYITQGKKYMEQSKYTKAIEEFEKAKSLGGATGEVESLVKEAKKWTVPREGTGKYAGMVYIPAGEFLMGSPEGEGSADEHPQHKVYLDAYYIDKYEVTFEQYDRFCEAAGRKKPGDEGWGRGNRPVINVSWEDANAYAKWAGKRLPTEAEWEKACRGMPDFNRGNTKYCFGDSESELGEYGWYRSNSGNNTHPVGQKRPNAFGLFDMHGNVWEWCSDWYDEKYYSSSPTNNPKGPDSRQYRVLRGGSWDYNASYCRSAFRSRYYPDFRSNIFGFRCAASSR